MMVHFLRLKDCPQVPDLYHILKKWLKMSHGSSMKINNIKARVFFFGKWFVFAGPA